jgi:hypothetical protein
MKFPDDDHITLADVGERLVEFRAIGARSGRALFVDLLAAGALQGIDLQARVLFVGGDARVADQHMW